MEMRQRGQQHGHVRAGSRVGQHARSMGDWILRTEEDEWKGTEDTLPSVPGGIADEDAMFFAARAEPGKLGSWRRQQVQRQLARMQWVASCNQQQYGGRGRPSTVPTAATRAGMTKVSSDQKDGRPRAQPG